MKSFSIKDLERLSGIKAHTIRIWEIRYRLFTPQRTNGNTRLYGFNDLQRLLTITLLLSKGKRISDLAGLTLHEIENITHSLTAEEDRMRMAVHHLILYKYSSDIDKFEDILDGCVLYWGIDATIEKIILPFLEKVRLLSYNDKSCETHFAVTAVRRKIILGIEKAKASSFNQQSALLFLAEGEHYDLMLLYMAYQLKQMGVRVLYLGTNVPSESLKQMIAVKKPDFLFTYIPQRQKPKLDELVSFLTHELPETILFIGTSERGQEQQGMANVKFLSVQETVAALSGDINAYLVNSERK